MCDEVRTGDTLSSFVPVVLPDQLSRLHMILKPFMLRRVKKDVENELSDKVCFFFSSVFELQSLLQILGKRKMLMGDGSTVRWFKAGL